jgi:hypothetical protein
MPWHDDSWRDSYDAWKLRSPYDDEDYQDGCDHPDPEIDILDGMYRCHCGHSWCATEQDIKAEIDRMVAAEEEWRRQMRWKWWHDLCDRVRSLFPGRPRVPATMFKTDDDIPF